MRLIVEGCRCGIVVHQCIERRQDHGSVRQARHATQQFCDGGDTACRPGGNDAPVGRGGFPGLDLSLKKKISPLGGIETPFCGQCFGPPVRDNTQELECFLPVFGITIRHDGIELVEVQAFGLNLIQQFAEVRREARRMLKGNFLGRRRLVADHACEKQLASQRWYGWGKRRADFRRHIGQQQFVLVRLADRPQFR